MADDLDALLADLKDARARTLALVADLPDDALIGPRLKIVNPLLWELGHIAWFQELWVLRRARGMRREDRDALYDSSNVPHDTRWDLPLLSRAAVLRYLNDVLDEVVRGAAKAGRVSEEERYFLTLSLFHEDMHGEALVMTRQTLAYPAPPSIAFPPSPARTGEDDVFVPGRTLRLGAERDTRTFFFDNEKWAHPVEVKPFSISRTPVTQRQFAAFVDAGGYARREHWSDEGWSWRTQLDANAPVYWRRGEGSGRSRRHFDRFVPLEPDLPMMHVSWFEAEAFCRWAQRRLPTEAEWEAAALPANGLVWEWTADVFEPFPGFSVDPYQDYSRPWFGTHQVLKGGSWVTRARLMRPAYRNFYTPDRRDVFAGLRTCAL